MDRTACTEPQCLYKGDLYLYFYEPASVSVFINPFLVMRLIQVVLPSVKRGPFQHF